MHFELRGTSIHLRTQVVSGTSKKEKAADKLNEALFHSNFESKLTMSAKEIVESFQPEHKEGIVIGISQRIHHHLVGESVKHDFESAKRFSLGVVC